jgi:hypothetical protein
MAEDLSGFTGEEGAGESAVPEPKPDTASSLAAEMAGAGAQGEPGKPDVPAAWTAQLPREVRENPDQFKKLTGFKSIGELAKAYLAGGGEADFSDVKKVLEKLGFPKEGEKYDWEEGLKDEMKGFAETARKAMLTKEQAKTVMEGMAALDAAKDAAVLASVKEAAGKVSQDLIKEFGDDALAWHRNAVKDGRLGRELARTGLSVHPTIARALALLGREMAEDYTPSGSRGGTAKPASVYDGAGFEYK